MSTSPSKDLAAVGPDPDEPAAAGASAAPRPADPTAPAGRLGRLLDPLRSGRAAGWYLGAGIALIWLLSPLALVVDSAATTLPAGLGFALLILFALVFLISNPLQQRMPPARRLVFPALLLLLSLCLLPWFGA